MVCSSGGEIKNARRMQPGKALPAPPELPAFHPTQCADHRVLME